MKCPECGIDKNKLLEDLDRIITKMHEKAEDMQRLKEEKLRILAGL